MHAIELKHVSFYYPNGYLANEDLSLSIGYGERLALVGQNGAGKTTAVKLMNGLYKPTKGTVLVNGEDTKERTTAQISRSVGYVFQNPDDQIFNSTVRAELEFLPKYQKLAPEEMERRVIRAVELTGIHEYMGLNPYEVPYAIRKFVTIAVVLIAEPQVIIFDEPTAGQDKISLERLSRLIYLLSEEGKSVITITHDMEFVAANFKRVVVMSKRKILMDADARTVFQNDEILKAARLKRPQMGVLAHKLGMEPILFKDEFVKSWLMKSKIVSASKDDGIINGLL